MLHKLGSRAFLVSTAFGVLFAFSTDALASTTEQEVQAAINVNNAFTLTEHVPLNMGTHVVSPQGIVDADCTYFVDVTSAGDLTGEVIDDATCNVPADQASMTQIVAPTRATFRIAGVPTSTVMTVVIPASLPDLECTGPDCQANQNHFTFSIPANTHYPETVTVSADPQDFHVGGRIETQFNATPAFNIYPDGVYTASYDVTVAY